MQNGNNIKFKANKKSDQLFILGTFFISIFVLIWWFSLLVSLIFSFHQIQRSLSKMDEKKEKGSGKKETFSSQNIERKLFPG